MVSGRRLSPGLLVGRRTAQSLLRGHDPAQAPETPEELPGANQDSGRGRLSRRAAQAVVDCRAEFPIRYGRDGNARLRRGVSLMQKIEQIGRGLNQLSVRTETRVAG